MNTDRHSQHNTTPAGLDLVCHEKGCGREFPNRQKLKAHKYFMHVEPTLPKSKKAVEVKPKVTRTNNLEMTQSATFEPKGKPIDLATPATQSPEATADLRCETCDRKFPTASGFYGHLYQKHGYVSDNPRAKKLREIRLAQKEAERQGITLPKPSNNNKQVQTAEAEPEVPSEKVTCPECGFVAGSPQGLGKHRSAIHGVVGMAPTTQRGRALMDSRADTPSPLQAALNGGEVTPPDNALLERLESLRKGWLEVARNQATPAQLSKVIFGMALELEETLKGKTFYV